MRPPNRLPSARALPALVLAALLPVALLAQLDPALAQNNPSAAPPTPPDVAGPPPSTTRTSSGLAYRVIRPGSGARAAATSTVSVHYSGWTTDGHLFDSSRTRGTAAEFPLTATIPGFAEGVGGMAVGEIRRVWIPESLAYGRTGRVPGMLVFDIELVAIVTP